MSKNAEIHCTSGFPFFFCLIIQIYMDNIYVSIFSDIFCETVISSKTGRKPARICEPGGVAPPATFWKTQSGKIEIKKKQEQSFRTSGR